MLHGRALALVFSLPLCAIAQTRSAAPELDHHQPMRLDGIQVSGTRLPYESIIKISGLKVGQMIDESVLKEATDKITSTGLVKGINYSYNVALRKQAVLLSLNVFDEGPLLPAHILPEHEAEPVWACLQSADPIFTREMPNTEKAIHFYSINIARCLSNSGTERTGHGFRTANEEEPHTAFGRGAVPVVRVPQERVSATVACDGSGKSIAINFHVPELSAQRGTASH